MVCQPNMENCRVNYMFLSSGWSFNNGLPTYTPFGQSIKHAQFPNTLPNKGLTHGINLQPCGKHPRDYLITGTTQPHQKSHLMISTMHFLLNEGTLSISHGGHHTPPLQRISQFESIVMYFQSHLPLFYSIFTISRGPSLSYCHGKTLRKQEETNARSNNEQCQFE